MIRASLDGWKLCGNLARLSWLASLVICYGCSSDLDGVYVSPSVQDFGTCDADINDSVISEFRVSNRTEKAVRLVKSLVPCICTKLPLPDEAILPGADASITMELKVRGAFGKMQFDATILTDHPQYPILQVAMAGRIKCERTRIDVPLGSFFPGENLEKSLELPFLTAELLSGMSHVKLDQTGIIQEISWDLENPLRVRVKGCAPLAIGPVQQVASLFFRERDLAMAVVHFQGSVVQRLDYTQIVYFGDLRPNVATELEWIISDCRGEGFEISELKADGTSGQLTWTSQRNAVGNGLRVVLVFRPKVGPVGAIEQPVTGQVQYTDGTTTTFNFKIAGFLSGN